MPDLSFHIEGCESVPFAATPLLSMKLRIDNTVAGEKIHTIVLRVQIQIEATRRSYTSAEKEKLADLFGEPDRWSRTLRPMLWTHAGVVLTAFTGSTAADLQVPCTFDFNVAATKYFYGVADGDIPLIFLFSGSVFYDAGDAGLQVAPIPWDKETRFRLPVESWRAMMNDYYPNTAWLALGHDVFDRVYQFKVRHGLQTWEAAFERLLETAEEPVTR